MMPLNVPVSNRRSSAPVSRSMTANASRPESTTIWVPPARNPNRCATPSTGAVIVLVGRTTSALESSPATVGAALLGGADELDELGVVVGVESDTTGRLSSLLW